MKNLSKRTLVITAIVLLLGAGIAYGWYQQSQNTLDPGGDQQTTEETTNGDAQGRVTEDQVQDTDGTDTSTNTTGDQDKKLEPSNGSDGGETGQTPEKPEVTRAEYQSDDQQVRVSAIFNKQSSGKCKLVLEKSGYSNVTRTAEIIVGPSYYACDGFRVERSALPAGGQWQATVYHQLNSNQSASETYTIKVGG